MPPGEQGAERQSEGSSTCTRAFQRNFLLGDSQVSTIISRRTESQILKNSWISEFVTLLVPTSCRKLTENSTSRFQTKPRHQEKGDVAGRLIRSMSGFGDASNIGCETGGVFSSQKGTQLARPILRYSSTGSEARGVQFLAAASAFLQTGLQSITSAKCWHPSARFVKAIDSDSGNIRQGLQWHLTESLFLPRVRGADAWASTSQTLGHCDDRAWCVTAHLICSRRVNRRKHRTVSPPGEKSSEKVAGSSASERSRHATSKTRMFFRCSLACQPAMDNRSCNREMAASSLHMDTEFDVWQAVEWRLNGESSEPLRMRFETKTLENAAD